MTCEIITDTRKMERKNLIIHLCLLITCKFCFINILLMKQKYIDFIFLIKGGYSKQANKISGGKQTSIIGHSFLASIKLRGELLCCASFINPSHVVGTASCVTSNKNIIYGNLQVLSTEYQNYQDVNRNTFDVSIVIIHPDYSPIDFWANDISILKVNL